MPPLPKKQKSPQSKKKPAPFTPDGEESIVDSIRPVGELPQSGIKLLITGASGSGKTTLACTAPKPLLLLRPEQVENGALSIQDVPGIEAPRPMTEMDQLDLLVEYVRSEPSRYQSVVLDGVQFYQDLVVKAVGGLKEIPAQLSWGILTQQDWGTVSNEVKERLRRFLRLADLGINTIITGGERTINDDIESDIIKPSVVVALQPSTAGWLNFVSDFIVNTYIKQKTVTVRTKIGTKVHESERITDDVEYCARTYPNSVYTVKFRVPKGTPLPKYVEDPTYDKLMELIRGEYQGE